MAISLKQNNLYFNLNCFFIYYFLLASPYNEVRVVTLDPILQIKKQNKKQKHNHQRDAN